MYTQNLKLYDFFADFFIDVSEYTLGLQSTNLLHRMSDRARERVSML